MKTSLMTIQQEFQQLFEKMLVADEQGGRAYQEYCVKRCQADQPQVEIDNGFLNFLASQPNIDNCSSKALSLAAGIYGQNDGYAKPVKLISLLETLCVQALPMPTAHRAYLSLPATLWKENILIHIYEQSKKLAEKSNAEAQSRLGYLYETGRGIPIAELPQKDKIAVEWYSKAASQGFASAQNNLGLMYLRGCGVPSTEFSERGQRAFEWLCKAAKQGIAGAQFNLGKMYEEGRGIPSEEIPQKNRIAIEWYRKAAAQGHGKAQQNLGCIYSEGLGCDEDEKNDNVVMAYFWYTRCAEQDLTIYEHRNKLKITPNQKKKAEMMLVRNLSYRQVKYLFEQPALKRYLLLLRIVLKNINSKANQLKPIEFLPRDLLLKIAEHLVPLSAVELKDLYNKIITPLPEEITFKAKYQNANNSFSLFFKSNPVVDRVKSGAPLPLCKVKKYAEENPGSLEAQIYSQAKVSSLCSP